MAVASRVAGRAAVVTGAASGIGEAVCLRLAEEGARVACLDVDEAGAARTAGAIAGESFAVGVDVSDEGQVAAAVAAAAERAGAIDALVNCAGIAGPQEKAAATPAGGWDRTQAVNLRGTFDASFITGAALPVDGGFLAAGREAQKSREGANR